MITILSVFPTMLDLNGDAQNALVLAQRARWAGHASRVVTLDLDDVAIEKPDVVVVGSGAESAIPRTLEALESVRSQLHDWVQSGVPLLAVGTGMEMLSDEIDMPDGGSLEGLGIFPGRATRADHRASDDIVVESEYARLIGYENHVRGFELAAGATPLGTVTRGTGNGPSSLGTEGVRVRSAIGTHLHGPILAKNPTLADVMLRASTLGERYDARNVFAGRVDDVALHARNAIATRLGLTAE